MKVRNRHSRLAYKRCSIAIYLAVFICNTLLCRLREEDIVVVIFIFMAIMKRLSIFIRVICNNRQFHFDIFSILQLSPLNYFLPNWQESGEDGGRFICSLIAIILNSRSFFSTRIVVYTICWG